MPSLEEALNDKCVKCGLEVPHFCGALTKEEGWICGYCLALRYDEPRFCVNCRLHPECYEKEQ
jgi:hypothetical protein